MSPYYIRQCVNTVTTCIQPQTTLWIHTTQHGLPTSRKERAHHDHINLFFFYCFHLLFLRIHPTARLPPPLIRQLDNCCSSHSMCHIHIHTTSPILCLQSHHHQSPNYNITINHIATIRAMATTVASRCSPFLLAVHTACGSHITLHNQPINQPSHHTK